MADTRSSREGTASGSDGSEFVALRDKTLQTLFRAGERIWLVAQKYNPVELMWEVDILRLGPQARWMLQRYSYDVSAGVLHFRGERPVSEDDLARHRQQGQRIH